MRPGFILLDGGNRRKMNIGKRQNFLDGYILFFENDRVALFLGIFNT